MRNAHVLMGAIAGCISTAPMTAAMVGLHAYLPPDQQYPLPPSHITTKIIEEGLLDTHLPPSPHRSLTLANHFAYGAACGALYTLVARKLPFSPALNGMLFGLGVWTVSYVGWLPLLQVFPSAARQPAPRNALMLAAHIIWGVSTGLLTNTFTAQQTQGKCGT